MRYGRLVAGPTGDPKPVGYSTVKVNVTLWLRLAVPGFTAPVTVNEYVPAGVAGPLPPLPPHAAMLKASSASIASVVKTGAILRLPNPDGFGARRIANAMKARNPNRVSNGFPIGEGGIGRMTGATNPPTDVATFTVTVVGAVPPGVKEAGVTVQVDAGGALVQASWTNWFSPPSGLKVNV